MPFVTEVMRQELAGGWAVGDVSCVKAAGEWLGCGGLVCWCGSGQTMVHVLKLFAVTISVCNGHKDDWLGL